MITFFIYIIILLLHIVCWYVPYDRMTTWCEPHNHVVIQLTTRLITKPEKLKYVWYECDIMKICLKALKLLE
jgi:hypothetical protein